MPNFAARWWAGDVGDGPVDHRAIRRRPRPEWLRAVGAWAVRPQDANFSGFPAKKFQAFVTNCYMGFSVAAAGKRAVFSGRPGLNFYLNGCGSQILFPLPLPAAAFGDDVALGPDARGACRRTSPWRGRSRNSSLWNPWPSLSLTMFPPPRQVRAAPSTIWLLSLMFTPDHQQRVIRALSAGRSISQGTISFWSAAASRGGMVFSKDA